jgi:hypothetical protein
MEKIDFFGILKVTEDFARSLARHWQNYLPGATSLHPSALPMWYWREL